MKKYVREFIARFRKFSIEKKLKWLRMVVIIPALVGIITLLVIMINFNESYNEAVKNVSVASKFNFSFSEDMDYKMYRIVIGAESFDAMKPYEEIKEAKELVKELNKNAVTDESKLRTRQIGKLLDNLKISIEEIEHSDLKNDYMENNQRLRLNVNVFTEIIKEKVSEYIYYEIGNMESMRVKLEKEIMHTITITLIAVLFLSLITWKLSKLISQSISYPVRQLCEMTKEVAQGNFDVHGPQNTTEELQILTNNFEHMAQKVERLIEDVKVEQQNLRKKELQLLQEQINPHFLYNTLDTMSGIANAQNCPMVSGMCHSLSAIFRYSLNMTDELSTVQNEMAHVRNYLYVMDVRNGSTIAYDYQIDSDTLADQMPRICIQPVVENALTHGLRNVRRKDKKLLIRSEHVNENLVITVQDNGAGMDAESMNRLLDQNDMKRVESGISIGILNVNARLKRLFGEKYGLHIESTAGEGTTVTITVPAVSTENSGDMENV